VYVVVGGGGENKGVFSSLLLLLSFLDVSRCMSIKGQGHGVCARTCALLLAPIFFASRCWLHMHIQITLLWAFNQISGHTTFGERNAVKGGETRQKTSPQGL
jgi:hypothetical protein